MASKKQTLNQFLKEKRIKKSMTQLEAGRALGHSTAQYISNFERGLCEPSIDTALKLCRIYGVGKRELYDLMLDLYSSQLKDKIFTASGD